MSINFKSSVSHQLTEEEILSLPYNREVFESNTVKLNFNSAADTLIYWRTMIENRHDLIGRSADLVKRTIRYLDPQVA